MRTALLLLVAAAVGAQQPLAKGSRTLLSFDAEARHLSSARIVRGILRVDTKDIEPALSPDGESLHTVVRVEVRETFHGVAALGVRFRHFVPSADYGGKSNPDPKALLALDGADRIVFLALSEGQYYLLDREDGQAVLPAERETITRVRMREMQHRAMLKQPLKLDRKRHRQVRELVKELCDGVDAQRESFAELEALGSVAVAEIIAAMDDRRPLPQKSLELINKSAKAFEVSRHYSPELVIDGIAAVLNQITGESFGLVYSGASDTERANAVRAWKLYAHYLALPKNAGGKRK